MAQVTYGAGTSHSPMLSVPGNWWKQFGERDHNNRELIYPSDGLVRSYHDALATVVSEDLRRREGDVDTFAAQYQRCEDAISQLAQELKDADPDVAIIVTDDQEEWFFEDNMPALAVYWGDSAPIVPRALMKGLDPEAAQLIRDGYGDVELDLAVAGDLGLFLIEYLIDHDFDVSHFNSLRSEYGGTVTARLPGLDGAVDDIRATAPRRMGLPHGVSFVVKRLFDNDPPPILPIFQNTCYPPNTLTPRRSYHLGKAIAGAVEAWPEDLTVAVIASGGLSHFVVDEDLDLMLLDALLAGDADTLTTLPRHRLRSGTSEILNWVTVGGVAAEASLQFRTVDYVPVYRTEAATGGGWGFGSWHR